MADVSTQQSAQDTLDVLLPGLAASGGVSIAALIGPPRTFRQYIAELGAGFLSGVTFGPSVAEMAGVSGRNEIALCAMIGLFGMVFLRGVVSIVDSIYMQVEAKKDETAKGIIAIVYAIANKLLLPRILAWARTPEIALVPPIPVPPPPPPPLVILQQMPPQPPAVPPAIPPASPS